MKTTIHYLVTLLVFAAAANAQIKFGSTLTLSGSAASFGQNARDGMELARLEINAAGGVAGQQLEIIYEDFGETDLKKAVSAAQKMINIDKVKVILPMITEDAEVIWPIAHRKNVLTMAIYAGGKDLTKDKPLFFQVSSSDEVLARVLDDYAIQHKSQGLCTLAEQSVYFLSIAEAAAQYWRSKVKSPAAVVEYDPNTSDFKPILLKMRSSGCEALFLSTSPNKQGSVLNQISQIGWKVLRLGLDTSEDANILNIAGVSADSVIYAKYLVATPEFKTSFKNHYGREVGVPAALAYDAVRLLSKVINENGLDANKINAGLITTKNYDGASGQISFDSEGTRLDRQAELWTIRSGKPEKLTR